MITDLHPEAATAVRLTELRTGDRARLFATDLAAQDSEMLYALGLASQSRFRLCKEGNPWIVQVRTTRIGISDAVADRLLVIPEAETKVPGGSA